MDHRRPDAQGDRRRSGHLDRGCGLLAPRVLEITGLLLKRASADLADMLYSIDQGVGEAAPVDSVKATVRWRYAAKNSTQTVSPPLRR